MTYLVNYSKKAQLKIQQMAFVLVALVIFFALAALFYFSISFSDLQSQAQILREKEAKEIVRNMVATPEFSSSICSACIDLDKVLMLKEKDSYKNFWNLDFLKLEKLYPQPESKDECTKVNYPNCKTITLIETKDFGSPHSAFVALCRYEQSNGGYTKCELGILYTSAKNIIQ